jgi:two-component system, response regulator, stage 0 sporulation protein F
MQTLGDPRAPRVVIAEDDVDIRAMLVATMKADGYEVVEARHGGELLDYVGSWLHYRREPRPDLIISDVRMPGFTGLEVLGDLRDAGCDVPMLLITAYGSPELEEEAREMGATVFEKPFELDDLRTVVWNLIQPPVTNRSPAM